MSRIGCTAYSIKSIGIALAFFLSASSRGAELGHLPFDHRRLLLVQMDQTTIPERQILSQILDEMRARGRYQWVLASKPGDPIAPVKVPRDFSWDSPPSVQKMAEKYGVDGVLWVQQRSQELLLKWYDGKEGLPLIFDSTFLRADKKTDDQDSHRITIWMDSIWARFPGVGFVAKRDSKYLYFEGAAENHLKAGDVVTLLRVESVTRHKLFKTLADFKTSNVGTAHVVGIDKILAKGEVTEESAMDPIRMGDRYQVTAAPLAVTDASGESSLKTPEPKVLEASSLADGTLSGLGTLSASMGYGKTSHTETTDSESPTLSRNAPAVELNAMGYITSQWLGFADYRYRFSTFTNPESPYTQSTINARLTSLALQFGYRFFLDQNNANFWLAPFIGYRKYSFVSGNQIATYGPASKKWNTIALGFQLRFPFDDVWHMRFVASKSMFISYSEADDNSGGNPVPSAAEVSGSLYANIAVDAAVGLGFRYQALGAKYTGAGDRSISATSTSLRVSELTLNYEKRF